MVILLASPVRIIRGISGSYYAILERDKEAVPVTGLCYETGTINRLAGQVEVAQETG